MCKVRRIIELPPAPAISGYVGILRQLCDHCEVRSAKPVLNSEPNDDNQRRAFCVRWIGSLGACSPRKLMKNKATHRGRVTVALPSEFAVGDDMFPAYRS